ncbi:MAG: hypothetical protein VR65_27960 [Desulfobulbaceae bacterium BRH_c16a]|nr:MAG: hypothetical protein VR65_27960 [Desulfobulbaceae bacterium BRH_c16a]
MTQKLNLKHASKQQHKGEKTMKKSILIIAAAAAITLTSTLSFACYWDGYWGGPMGGPMAMVNGGGNSQGFYEKTAKIRQDLAAKQGEYGALMATTNPDPQRAADLNREMTVLHDQLSAQAKSFNLPAPGTGNYGHMNGYGMYGCW